jgi:hypothetical protein
MIVHTITFDNSIIGEIHFNKNSFIHSTNESMDKEYRCYIIKNEYKTYLTSFDTLSKATEYLLHLEGAGDEKFMW